MAIYNPPKENNWASILTTAGVSLAGVGGGLAATGVGVVPGIIAASVGGIAAGVGTIMNGNSQKRQQDYDRRYQARLNGENNLQASINNIRSMTGLK